MTMKKIRLSRIELANRLIAISNELDVIRKLSNNGIVIHYLSELCDVDKRGYCDEENNRVEKLWFTDEENVLSVLIKNNK